MPITTQSRATIKSANTKERQFVAQASVLACRLAAFCPERWQRSLRFERAAGGGSTRCAGSLGLTASFPRSHLHRLRAQCGLAT